MRVIRISRRRSSFAVAFFAACLAAIVLVSAGCGGGRGPGSGEGGRATITIVWPGRSRLIPLAANSIRIQMKQGAQVVGSQIVPRPAGGTSTVTFDNLPTGNLIAEAMAFPQADGSGVAQASGTVPLTIAANQNTSFTITMDSTVDHIELSPAAPTVAVGATVQMAAVAKNSAGDVVLTSPSKIEWSSGSAAATVNASGLVTGVADGTATITVTDAESGKSASTLVSVSGQTYMINGVPYIASNQTETVTATFTQPDGGVSTSAFSGYVLLTVSGTGTSYFPDLNDAFYLYTGIFAPATNGHDGGYYQLTFGTSPLQIFSLASNATNFLVDPMPAYNPSHEYTFILDTQTVAPANLHFGVSDGGFSDNAGDYTVKIVQLVPAP